MKQLVLFLGIFICIESFGQSFEAVTVPFFSTAPTASRSAHFVDVNGDSYDDIFITNGLREGQNNNLFINNGDETFTQVTTGDIVSDDDRSVGASFADADNDGDLDLVVTTFGQFGVAKKNYFYLNDGAGQFNHQAESAIGATGTYSEAVNWIDVNGDEKLDVFITNSVGAKQNPYFENNGDGTFVQKENTTINSTGLSSRSIDWVDYDGDGHTDIFVTNEGGQRNELYKSNGDGSFTKITNVAISSTYDSATGSSWADIDNDGDYDLFMATFNQNGAKNKLYRNRGNGEFRLEEDSAIADLVANSFGSSFADVDNDGDLDLLVCNSYLPSVNTNYLYINDGSGNFTLDQTSALANYTGNTYSCAFGDFNKDGWQDVILANNQNDEQPNALFKNTGSGNHFISLKLMGTASNKFAVGARVAIKAKINDEWVWQYRFVSATSGYCSQNSYTIHFGLGDATEVEELKVEWPSGEIDEITNIAADQFYTLVESGGLSSTSDMHTQVTFDIYPNPSDDSISFSLPRDWKHDVHEVVIVNSMSQVVMKQSWQQGTIRVASLPAGMYVVQLVGEAGVLATSTFTKK